MCKAPKALLSGALGLSELLNSDHYRNYRIQCRLCLITQSVAVAHCDMFTRGFFVSPFVPIVRRYRKFGCTVIGMLDLFLFRTHARLDFFAVCVCVIMCTKSQTLRTRRRVCSFRWMRPSWKCIARAQGLYLILTSLLLSLSTKWQNICTHTHTLYRVGVGYNYHLFMV